MLTSLRIQNFKAWKESGDIRLAPLTVIFGANSAGKSSLGHLLQALKQTVQSVDRKQSLQLGDENSLTDLGTFAECIHGHDLGQPLRFSLGWQAVPRLELRDPLSQRKYMGNRLQLDVSLLADQQAQPQVEHLGYRLGSPQAPELAFDYARDEQGLWQLQARNYQLVRSRGRSWPLEAPDKFYRISDQSRAHFQNADVLNDLALQLEGTLSRLYFLGPLREYPRRVWSWSGDTPESVGHKGERAIHAILAARAQGRLISRGPRKRQLPFDEFIARWLQDLGIIHSFRLRPLAEGRKEYEVLVRTHAGASEVRITDVGFGVSQLLPALVQAFYCPPDSTVWLEQPEIHLHPQVQAELADVFISAIQARENGRPRNAQLIVESHSEHFLNRLQRRIAEGALQAQEVAVYFCRKAGAATELEPLRLNEYGEIENWPDNFFGDEMADIAGRTMAVVRRMQARHKESAHDQGGD
ncbi:MAG: DUF3696 domain-containing protein [Pseudomonas sp.]|nr:MAG: DUF3696 domain-containing protein [Pseudomonas sp.]